jgi:hypothetical protein
MRTTLELDNRLHETARRIAFEQRRSLGDVVSELALRGLEQQAADQRPVRQLGQFAGLIHIADDFDDTPADIDAAVDEPLT